MKKLTTNQILIGGGVIALVWILYKKKKAKNGSDMIKDALNGQIPDVSVSDGDKGTNEPVISIPTGETKYPIRKKPYKRPIEKLTIDEVIEQVPQCEDLISKWKGILVGKKWRTKADMEAERFAFLGYYCEKRYLATNRSDWEISNSLPILRQL